MTESGSVVALPVPAAVRPPWSSLGFAQALTGTPRRRLSGEMLVQGDPGGSFHFRGGTIVEVSSPGAPGVETLLLRSGRVSAADWAAASQAGAAAGRLGAELVERALIGTAELQVVCLMAALDGALAMGMGRVDGFTLEPDSATPLLTAPQGIEPEWLLQESERRIRALGLLGLSISPFRGRLALTDKGAARADAATGERREILLRANGRCSPRDIAFQLGRSLYAITVQVSRMMSEGLLVAATPPQYVPVEPLTASGGRIPTLPGVSVDRAGTGGLPHRQRGASGINDVLPLRPAGDHWRTRSTLPKE